MCVLCSKCGNKVRHWVHTPKDDRGRKTGPPEKHVNCTTCKEHWVYEKPPSGEGYRLIPRLLPQIEMF